MVDASRIYQGKRLWSLYLPIIGFVSYVFRTMNVMYESTLVGRSSGREYAATCRMKTYPHKWLAGHRNKSTIIESFFEDHSEPYNPRHDFDARERGALQLYVPHSTAFNQIDPSWTGIPSLTNDIQRAADWRHRNRIASEEMKIYWPWTGETELVKPEFEEVPTTFRSLGKDPTLKLIVEGYLKTREVLFWSKTPELSTFNSLMDLDLS